MFNILYNNLIVISVYIKHSRISPCTSQNLSQCNAMLLIRSQDFFIGNLTLLYIKQSVLPSPSIGGSKPCQCTAWLVLLSLSGKCLIEKESENAYLTRSWKWGAMEWRSGISGRPSVSWPPETKIKRTVLNNFIVILLVIVTWQLLFPNCFQDSQRKTKFNIPCRFYTEFEQIVGINKYNYNIFCTSIYQALLCTID